jgi:hypothetical protein
MNTNQELMNTCAPQKTSFPDEETLVCWVSGLHRPWTAVREGEIHPFGWEDSDESQQFDKEEWLRKPENAAWYYARLELARTIWAHLYVAHDTVAHALKRDTEMVNISFKTLSNRHDESLNDLTRVESVKTELRVLLRRAPTKKQLLEQIKKLLS